MVFSGSEVAGEGEHKIMDFIRERQRTYTDYSSDEVHSMYGLVCVLSFLLLLQCLIIYQIEFKFIYLGCRSNHVRAGIT